MGNVGGLGTRNQELKTKEQPRQSEPEIWLQVEWNQLEGSSRGSRGSQSSRWLNTNYKLKLGLNLDPNLLGNLSLPFAPRWPNIGPNWLDTPGEVETGAGYKRQI